MRTLWQDDIADFNGEFVDFAAVRLHPKPSAATIPITVGGNGDAALERVATWGDGWYGFNLDGVAEVDERMNTLRRLCARAGRDIDDLHCAVALQAPSVGDVAALVDLGVDELVIVESPPQDPDIATDWVGALADRWITVSGGVQQ